MENQIPPSPPESVNPPIGHTFVPSSSLSQQTSDEATSVSSPFSLSQVVSSPTDVNFPPAADVKSAAYAAEPDLLVSEQPLAPTELLSQPVVRVLSPRGVEYVFLTIALFTGAVGLAGALISLVNGQTSFDVLSFPVAALVVSLPVFAWLFLRLKRTELANPSLRHEASKRRSTQFTQIATFVVSFFTIIGFVTTLFAKIAGQYHGSIGKLFLDVLVVLLIAGGMLAYYWRDEHRLG